MPISSYLSRRRTPHFRESIAESLLNVPTAKMISEYPEVSSNLYIRVIQDLERHPDAALIIDLASDPESALKVMEKVKQAAPDLYILASNYHADGETVIAAVRAGANDFLTQPLKRIEFRDAMARLERTPRRASVTASRLGKVYSFLGVKGGVFLATLAVPFRAAVSICGRSGSSASSRLFSSIWISQPTIARCRPEPRHNIRLRKWAKIFRAWTRRCLKASSPAILSASF